jgi:hypothetical protein
MLIKGLSQRPSLMRALLPQDVEVDGICIDFYPLNLNLVENIGLFEGEKGLTLLFLYTGQKVFMFLWTYPSLDLAFGFLLLSFLMSVSTLVLMLAAQAQANSNALSGSAISFEDLLIYKSELKFQIQPLFEYLNYSWDCYWCAFVRFLDYLTIDDFSCLLMLM